MGVDLSLSVDLANAEQRTSASHSAVRGIDGTAEGLMQTLQDFSPLLSLSPSISPKLHSLCLFPPQALSDVKDLTL